MRICILLGAAIAAAVSTGCSSLNLAQPAGGQVTGHVCPYCNPTAVIAQQQAMASQVQLAGYHAPGEVCEPGVYGTYAFSGHGLKHPGHPGRPFDGGWYGPFGSAHRTPGYPKRHHLHREYIGPQGPPTAQVAYPYYTTRGPRDFLLDNPPSIGR
jgi:hypothetical protein